MARLAVVWRKAEGKYVTCIILAVLGRGKFQCRPRLNHYWPAVKQPTGGTVELQRIFDEGTREMAHGKKSTVESMRMREEQRMLHVTSIRAYIRNNLAAGRTVPGGTGIIAWGAEMKVTEDTSSVSSLSPTGGRVAPRPFSGTM